MEENNNSLEYWLGKIREARKDKEIKELADILFEAILWQLEGKVEEPRVERPKKPKIDLQKFHY